MNRSTLCAAALILLLGLVGTPGAQAQTDVKLGPRIGIPVGDLEDAGATLSLGVDTRFETGGVPVVFNPSFDFYLFDDPEGVDQSAFAIDLNVLYEFGVDNAVFTPYAGGGLGIVRSSTDFDDTNLDDQNETDLGINIVGGARFLLEPVEPFVQLNATLGGDIDRLGVTGGVLFNL